mmetsp:Transcript_121540/g.190692  ORF Transcript_121540/g.190692 Transcript_121540/m.190692 type:complete len:95 (+) Transcript_121540:1431-1715(+)|eukprot:CAMPEP_0169410070 /NCGR_PEP_ID=MMETSP1017-20121227/59582_1 /TAXON_ID=342587 /ORGANISM="Karlodinium micrum, Strain CCMP2283" /LENGTH=94 /DNA_ID=CAMNT_0009517305 /DNA_START=152 /DNA_END=436 /DNA_ORIENTATION=+
MVVKVVVAMLVDGASAIVVACIVVVTAVLVLVVETPIVVVALLVLGCDKEVLVVVLEVLARSELPDEEEEVLKVDEVFPAIESSGRGKELLSGS